MKIMIRQTTHLLNCPLTSILELCIIHNGKIKYTNVTCVETVRRRKLLLLRLRCMDGLSENNK